MAHNIFQSKLVLNAKRGPAWHGLGYLVDEPMTTVEASAKIGLDKIVFSKHQVFTTIDGETIEVPDQMAIVREATTHLPAAFVASCSAAYPIMQNTHIAQMLEGLSREWPVESAGLFGEHGETVFFALQAGTQEVAGDAVTDFFVITDTRRPGTSLRILYTPVRVVCQNTLALGISRASVAFKIPHIAGTFEEMTRLRVDMMAQMRGLSAGASLAFATLAKHTIDREDVAAALQHTYPEPPVPSKVVLSRQLREMGFVETPDQDASIKAALERYEAVVARTRAQRDDVTVLYEKFNDEFPRSANTAWALLNAVTEFADHRIGGSDTRRRAASAMFGERAEEKARVYRALTTTGIIKNPVQVAPA